ncbi:MULTISPECIES: hypothetical protein [unclassified Spirosoma]|uniref:hypothetical protein n=1 Tax=unclassified Spirosoma TaxID=2621999 RepID=UPI000963E71B|nr:MULTISPECIES: hypothetical protein [unclassified Spirosoma]OJW76813.1 MAG: hypothetical protein BGO59_21525 [Spirosoma sp. 48-14]
MKHCLLFLFLFCQPIWALAQIIEIDTSETAPPPIRRNVLTDDPEQRSTLPRSSTSRTASGRQSDYLLLHQLREIQTWSVAIEGGFRSDASNLTNTFNRLVSSATQFKGVWSVLAGYTYRNAWAVETGYARAPIHLNITIANGSQPLVFTYQNSGSGIPVRLKRRIGSGKKAENGTGFWVTGGAWLIPNGTKQLDDFKLIGYIYGGRNNRIDTLRLDNITSTNQITGLAEAGFEYNVRLSSSLELGGYLRKFWGLGDALRSDMIYSVNKSSIQYASATANGTGWGFGMSLRYIYGKQHELKQERDR